MLAKYLGPTRTVEYLRNEFGPINFGQVYDSNEVTHATKELVEGENYNIDIVSMGNTISFNGVVIVPPQAPIDLSVDNEIILPYTHDCFQKQWEPLG